MTELHELTAVQQRDLLAKREISALDLVQHYLARIARLNPLLNAFPTVTEHAALRRAQHMDASRSATGSFLTPGTLCGVPYAEKDLFSRAGVRTTFGSKLHADWFPVESDEVLLTLDAAGGISLGKTATCEFGLSCYCENDVAPVARNPYDIQRGPGGSSGGAAVAVASGMLPVALGSDGGGSIRIPAAATGLVGFKPTRGLLPSSSGIESLAGLVVSGPLARTVGDAALFLDAMLGLRGSLAEYPFTLRAPGRSSGSYLQQTHSFGTAQYRIALLTDSPWDASYDRVLSREARSAYEDAARLLSSLGHHCEEISFAAQPEYADAFRTVWQVGAARIPADQNSEQLLEPFTRWLMHRGRNTTAAQLSDALSTLVSYERLIISRFSPFDAVLTPALADTPRPLGFFDSPDPEHNFDQQVLYTPYTSLANVAGLPAIALPISVSSEGLPMAVQLIGRPGGEGVLFALGQQLENIVNWQLRRPMHY